MTTGKLQHAAEDLSEYLEEQQELTEKFPVDSRVVDFKLAIQDKNTDAFDIALDQAEANQVIEWLHGIYEARIARQKEILKDELNGDAEQESKEETNQEDCGADEDLGETDSEPTY